MRGGKRPNSGRPKGAPNKATQQRQAKAADGGMTPPEMMLENARHFYAEAIEAEGALADFDPADAMGEGGFDLLLSKVKAVLNLRKEAQACARDAAPYYAPRLAAIEHSGQVTITHEEALDELERSGKGDKG
jgi:hypothetical protein